VNWKSKEIREIGLEVEYFLLRKDEIMEPKKFGFLYDIMGFLVENRSWPAERLEPIEMSLALEEIRYNHRAEKFGMHLSNVPSMRCTGQFVDYMENTYHISEFPDYTENIYSRNSLIEQKQPVKQSHHTGVFLTHPEDEKPFTLTAGIHVHFSSRNKKTGEIIELPVKEIVQQMDETFKYDIAKSGRIKGEWEPKMEVHGFEYRSLPANTDIHRVLRQSFKILRSV